MGTLLQFAKTRKIGMVLLEYRKAFGQLQVNYPLILPKIVHPYRKYAPSETMI